MVTVFATLCSNTYRLSYLNGKTPKFISTILLLSPPSRNRRKISVRLREVETGQFRAKLIEFAFFVEEIMFNTLLQKLYFKKEGNYA
jgi:hypothetical protein